MEPISTGNEELDTRLGGGIPVPNVLIIEGDHGTAKTAFAQQIAFGATSKGRRTLIITTEFRVRELLMQSEKISLNLTPAYIKGALEIFHIHIDGIRWSREVTFKALNTLVEYLFTDEGKSFDVVILDSLTPFMMYLSIDEILNFISKVKLYSEIGKLVVLTLHPKVLSEDVKSSLIMMSDSYIRLSIVQFGGKLIKSMEVIKFRGTPNPVETMIAFDVDPAFGIKVVPLALAKA